MILKREIVVNFGKEYKFKATEVDGTYPKRANQIDLYFDDKVSKFTSDKDWERGEKIFVTIDTDIEGFAIIKSTSKKRPSTTEDFVEAKVFHVTKDSSKIVKIKYPFDKYFHEEINTYRDQVIYRNNEKDSIQNAYALVSIRAGESMLVDVIIEGSSIKDILKQERENKESEKTQN